MHYIKQGYGFNVGLDFTRADKDIPIEIDYSSARTTYGYIVGNPESKLGFMRDARVRVAVDNCAIIENI